MFNERDTRESSISNLFCIYAGFYILAAFTLIFYRTMSDHGSSARPSDADIDRFLQSLSPDQLDRVMGRAATMSRASTAPTSQMPSPSHSEHTAASASSRRSRSRLSRQSGGRSCCGREEDVVSPATATHSAQSTPRTTAPPTVRQTPVDSPEQGSPDRTPTVYGREVPQGFSYLIDRATGEIIMTPEGKQVMSRMRQLCRQVFRHTVMVSWRSQERSSIDYIISTLHREFPVPSADSAFDDAWMRVRMRDYMKHRRSDARTADTRPAWLDREEWRGIREERATTPDRWHQQREAARARVEAGSSHHLGSGGWATFEEDFVRFLPSSLFYLCIFSLVVCVLHKNLTLDFNLCSIV